MSIKSKLKSKLESSELESSESSTIGHKNY